MADRSADKCNANSAHCLTFVGSRCRRESPTSWPWLSIDAYMAWHRRICATACNVLQNWIGARCVLQCLMPLSSHQPDSRSQLQSQGQGLTSLRRRTLLVSPRFQEGTRSAEDKLKRHSQERSARNGTHLGIGGGGSFQQTRMAWKVAVNHRLDL